MIGTLGTTRTWSTAVALSVGSGKGRLGHGPHRGHALYPDDPCGIHHRDGDLRSDAHGRHLDEYGETVAASGSGTGLTVTGTNVTITDNDDAPLVSVADTSATEGDDIEFTVTL